jgi:segregation and condensation protein B
MLKRQSPPPSNQPEAPSNETDSLGLEDFVSPDDQGLSLDELSQAYAALLQKGNDPYSDSTSDDNVSPEAAPNEPSAVDSTDRETNFDITPRSILEGVLFVGNPTGEPLTSERIAALMRGVQPSEIDDLVRELNEIYEARNSALRIESVGPGYQLTLSQKYRGVGEVFLGRIREARLSQAAVDVLAIVAYHQPVSVEQIDRLRGKVSGPLLAQLVRRDLLQLEEPAEKRTKRRYRTTARFLRLFGLDAISDLPQSHDAG